MLNISMTNDVAGRVRLLVHRSIRQRAFQANTNITNQIRSRATYCPWARLPVKSHANTSTRCSLLKTYLRDWIHQFNAGGNITNLKERIYDKLILVTSILQKQSNVYITLRVRQFAQLINLYHRLYSPSEFRQMFIATLLRRLNLATVLQNGRQSSLMRYFAKRRHLLLSLATCSVFSWNADGIRDKEFEDLVNEFALFEKMKQKHTPGSLDIENNQIENYKATTIDQHSFMVVNCLEDDQSSKPQSYSDWEVIINRPNFSVLRKAVQNTSLYEYKVFGSFFDISAYSFYLVQMDLDFRKEWDNLVLKLSVIEKESNASLESAVNVEDTGNELIHWVMKFPYPMKSREYIYIRRSRIDYERKYIILISRAVPSTQIAETGENVRVHDYVSQMIIKPHTGGNFMKPGFDYMLTYFDNPRASFPSPAYNWMASRGVPDFVEQLHQAAIKLSRTKLEV